MMGRSVETVSDATATAYSTFEPQGECLECDGTGETEENVTCIECGGAGEVTLLDETGEEWRSFLEWVSKTACELFPSMHDDERFLPYPHRETIIVASNAHSAVTVSEYGGMVAISLIPDYDRAEYWKTEDPLGEHWRQQVSERFLAEFSEFERVGGASDGTSIYVKATP